MTHEALTASTTVQQNFTMLEKDYDERPQFMKYEYCYDLRRSMSMMYLKQKYFVDTKWVSGFCTSPYRILNRFYLIYSYRILLFLLAIIDIIYGIVNQTPIAQWLVYLTHYTLIAICLAILNNFILTTILYINLKYHTQRTPWIWYQVYHSITITIALGAGCIVFVLFWTLIFPTSPHIHNVRTILDHGILWSLLFVDIFCFTRFPIYMIDVIPLFFYALFYAILTVIFYATKIKLSRERVGYVYSALNLNKEPTRAAILLTMFTTILPPLVIFLFWNIFRLRRTTDVGSSMSLQSKETTTSVASPLEQP
ncbi:unnamed protein product [Didymodactylos carnosus]|uniref:Uncharacterized protein n=1 Tax=Didymodactylos carnosus TaxID=1234261 RepID=A0A816AGJ3_9BILA|nr:unnamed protein product [Didymodactylos carnosus]CAF1595538.1 unnamed protein product [Didymodactylos carnosus]CAF3585102.1 unnamed protein product [Didymodactylos carnosus]CAF4470025.1 unnamed protein product [Didymodactylos carnosus]